MRYVQDRTGRFGERPHYEAVELDRMFEKLITDFLKAKHGSVVFPVSTDDLTLLIEQDAEDLDPYADLSGYGKDVEGVTEFVKGRKPKVRIAQNLATSENRENRFRTTLTHEYGHVRLHAYMFEFGTSGGGLFTGKAKPAVIACKRETIVAAKQIDWMEWQAGYACGALLMPASRIKAVAGDYQASANVYGPVPAATDHGQAMIDRVVESFQVSREAARVRLSVLGVLGTAPATGSLFG